MSLQEIRQRIGKGCGKHKIRTARIEWRKDRHILCGQENKLCQTCKAQLKGFDEGLKAARNKIEGEMKNVIDNRLSFLSEINSKIDFEAKKVNGLIIIELKELRQKLLGVGTK